MSEKTISKAPRWSTRSTHTCTRKKRPLLQSTLGALTLAAGFRYHVELAAENTCATTRRMEDGGSELERIIFLTGGSMVARKSGEGIMLNDAEDSVVLINVEHTIGLP